MSRPSTHALTLRDALIGAAFILGLMGGFGAWVVSRAEAATDAPQRGLERLEQKVDGILLMMIEERRANGRPIPKEVENVVR